MASTVLDTAAWAASEPLITAPLLYLLTRGPPHIRERILAPFQTNLLARNSVARVATLITVLKVLTSLGVVKRINAAMNSFALNKWTLGRKGKEWKFGPRKEELILITGGSSGIGYEMVKGFSKDARVVVIDISPFPEELAKLSDVSFYRCDITDFDAVADVCSQIRNRHGDPTVLINNAGIGSIGRSVLESTNESTEKLFKVNLLSHFVLIRELLPAMLRNRKGHIVTIASMASFIAGAGLLDYCCSKVGALYLSDGIRAECLHRYPDGESICTTSVHPSWHATGIIPESDFKKLQRRGVRVDPPSNVADVVVEQVRRGRSGRLFVPRNQAFLAGNRNWPLWVQDLVTGIWRGRQRNGFRFRGEEGAAVEG
ncbi:NAD(P)-binding protein [Lentithecium fluviatile CBS 122367]|uniref:NAD(P)-binding protein n=1 Tax=Lentithecium fluviatile CBS 122367 TaxID=1168545 RepID=A0A6G1IK60_9PLEO|nr:NAD(P)-binding protein [Lentithecium fluviatile CBS 122367]